MSHDQPDADGGELAVLVGGQLDVLDLAAALDRGQGVLAALLVPAHGHAVLAGQRHAEQLLGVDVELRAERPTDAGRHDPHLVLGDAEGEGGHDLQDVRDLGGRVQRHAAAERLRHGGHRPRLHRHRDETLLDVALLDGVGGGGERGVDGVLADLELPRVALVRARVVVDDDPVAQRVLEVDHGGERLVLDVDGAERVLRLGLAAWPAPRPPRRPRSRPSTRPPGSGAGSSCPAVTGHAQGIGRGPQVLQVGAGVGGDDAGLARRHRSRRRW